MTYSIVALDRETGAVAIDTALEVGDSLMFCRRDGDAAEEDLRRMSAEARRGLGAEPRGALVVDLGAGDRREELLLSDSALSASHAMRRELSGMSPEDALSEVLGIMRRTSSNADLLDKVAARI